MSPAQQARRPTLMERLGLIRTFLVIALGVVFFAATGARSEIFKKEDLLRGVAITHAQCDATPQTLWLNVHGRDFCVRYYLSTVGGEGKRPVVVLQGDQLRKLNLKTWTWMEPSEAKDVN